MRTVLAWTILLVWSPALQPAFAQGLYGLTPPRPGDLPVAPGRASTFEKRSSSSWYNSRSISGVHSAWIRPHWSYSLNRITLLSISPVAVATPQPVVIVPVPEHHQEAEPNVERVPPPARPEAQAPPLPEAIDPGTPASVFRPIQPEDRAWAIGPAVPEPARPAQTPLPAVPEPKEVLLRLPGSDIVPGPPVAATDPKTASAQFIALGNEAFKMHQYSRAERSFRRATEEVPGDARAYFLLAQARFALGKYAEAVAAIQAGLRLKPDWPEARFRPRDLYQAGPNDFSEHLHRLADALARYPDEPVLTFLYAYELWFDNRKDEARMLFQQAKALATYPGFSERFLQTKADSG